MDETTNDTLGRLNATFLEAALACAAALVSAERDGLGIWAGAQPMIAAYRALGGASEIAAIKEQIAVTRGRLDELRTAVADVAEARERLGDLERVAFLLNFASQAAFSGIAHAGALRAEPAALVEYGDGIWREAHKAAERGQAQEK